MSKKHIYLVRVLPAQILLFTSLLLSFYPLYPFTVFVWWLNNYVTEYYILWSVFYHSNSWWLEIPIPSWAIILANFHLLILIVSMVYYVKRSNEVNKFEGFPSIKDAIKYQKEKLKLEKLEKKHLKKQKIDQAKSLYLYKMQQLEEEKKKYL